MTRQTQRGRVITLGNFDGVHLGHRALVAAARRQAEQRSIPSCALFFDPHPARVLNKDGAGPALLTTPARRTELLRAAGVDEVAIEHFDERFAAHTPESFVREILATKLDARAIVVGPDFRFGRERVGDVDVLRTLGREHGFDVETVPPVELEGERVSSTRIRNALAAGDLATATKLLARYHDVDAPVVRGDQRGRTIGFPTANLGLAEIEVVVPKDGVYAVVARTLDGAPQRFTGVANIGQRPTFAAGRSIEAHLFDFDGDLYDRRLRVAFVRRLRDEMKLAGLDALRERISKDVSEARGHTRELPNELLTWL